MKHLFILSFIGALCAFPSSMIAQTTWQWAERGEGPQNTVATAIAKHPDGSSVVTGTYRGSVSFGTQTISSPDEDGIFIAKFGTAGNTYWLHLIATGDQITPRGISVDDEGRIAITGSYQGTTVFIPGFFGGPITAVGAFDVFVAMYASDGTPLWARSLGEAGFDYGAGISHDAEGNVYVNGEFHQTSTEQSASKLFIAKYDVDGNHLWTTQSADYGTYHLGNGIATDADGNSCITGEFFDVLTLGTITLNSGNAEATVYVAKIDPDGIPLWAQMAGAGGYAVGEGVGMNAEGDAYITGFYRGNVAFGPLTLDGPAEVAYDVFVAKCASSDGTFQWATRVGGPGTNDIGHAITVDALGNSYVNGSFEGSFTAGATTLQTAGGADMFIAKFSPEGNAFWATSCGGTLDETIGGIAIIGQDVYVAGGFEQSILFNANISLTGPSGVVNAFVARLNEQDVSGIPELEAPSPVLYPDPATDGIQLLGTTGEQRYAIIDAEGRKVRSGTLVPQQRIPVADLPGGPYVLRLVDQDDRTAIRQLAFIKR